MKKKSQPGNRVLWEIHSFIHSYRIAVMGQKVSLIGVEGHVPREALTVPILLVRKAVDIV